MDAGSTRTRCLAFGRTGKESAPVVLSYADEPSSGWSKGTIADEDAVFASIARAVSKVSRGKDLADCVIVCGIGSPGITGRASRNTLNLAGKRRVDGDDIAAIGQLCGQVLLPNTEAILSVVPTHWQIDGNAVSKLRGAVGSQIACDAYNIIAPAYSLAELESTFGHLKLARPVLFQFEALAASLAVLSKTECRQGALVIDIGAQSSGMAAWQEDSLIAASGLVIGGDLFTRDAAYILQISFGEAEQLKIDYGMSAPMRVIGTSQPDKLDLSMRRNLRIALEARAYQFVGHIKEKADFLPAKNGWTVVLVGGGAQLKGLPAYMEDTLGCSVRLGSPGKIPGLPENLKIPEMSVVAGLAMSNLAMVKWIGEQ